MQQRTCCRTISTVSGSVNLLDFLTVILGGGKVGGNAPMVYNGAEGGDEKMTSKESTRDLEDSLLQSLVKRLTRGIGWIVCIAGFGAIVVYGFTEFLLDPGVEVLFKVFLLTGLLGLFQIGLFLFEAACF